MFISVQYQKVTELATNWSCKKTFHAWIEQKVEVLTLCKIQITSLKLEMKNLLVVVQKLFQWFEII